MSKIILTKGQADAIENARLSVSDDNLVIEKVKFVVNFDGFTDPGLIELNELTTDTLIKALYIGYEVEPEFKKGDKFLIEISHGHTVVEYVGVINDDVTKINWEDGAVNSIDRVKELLSKKEIKPATKTQVKKYEQRRFWQENGRKVWELKKGDVLSKDKRKMSTVNWVDSLGVSFNEFGFFANWHEVKKYYKIACFAHDRKDLKND